MEEGRINSLKTNDIELRLDLGQSPFSSAAQFEVQG